MDFSDLELEEFFSKFTWQEECSPEPAAELKALGRRLIGQYVEVLAGLAWNDEPGREARDVLNSLIRLVRATDDAELLGLLLGFRVLLRDRPSLRARRVQALAVAERLDPEDRQRLKRMVICQPDHLATAVGA